MQRLPRGPSILRWAGSKTKSLNALAQFWTEGATYVEPFCGSASLFFHIKPNAALLADLNKELINALRCVSARPKKLWRLVSEIPRDAETFYEKRSLFNSKPLPNDEAARLFIYLNRNCFNGLWRTNKKGRFNVPHGGDRTGATPTLEHFLDCARQLRRAKLVAADFRNTILDHCRDGNFIYLDPPYASSRSRIFTDYNAKAFTEADFQDLIDLLIMADRGGAKFLLTYRNCSRLRKLPRGWNKSRVSVTRNVGGFSSSRKRDTEIIVTNVQI